MRHGQIIAKIGQFLLLSKSKIFLTILVVALTMISVDVGITCGEMLNDSESNSLCKAVNNPLMSILSFGLWVGYFIDTTLFRIKDFVYVFVDILWAYFLSCLIIAALKTVKSKIKPKIRQRRERGSG